LYRRAPRSSTPPILAPLDWSSRTTRQDQGAEKESFYISSWHAGRANFTQAIRIGRDAVYVIVQGNKIAFEGEIDGKEARTNNELIRRRLYLGA